MGGKNWASEMIGESRVAGEDLWWLTRKRRPHSAQPNANERLPSVPGSSGRYPAATAMEAMIDREQLGIRALFARSAPLTKQGGAV